MNRFELIGKIVEELVYQDEDTFLAMCEEELTDDTINVVIYGKDDTEHLLASPTSRATLDAAVERYANYTKVMPEHAH